MGGVRSLGPAHKHNMPLTHTKLSGATMGIADRDYYLDENRELTTDADKAAFRLINKGQDVPKEMADKYGIGKVAQPEKAAADAVDEKAAKPTVNKSVKPTKNKGVK